MNKIHLEIIKQILDIQFSPLVATVITKGGNVTVRLTHNGTEKVKISIENIPKKINWETLDTITSEFIQAFTKMLVQKGIKSIT
jgi:hypothetical protein